MPSCRLLITTSVRLLPNPAATELLPVSKRPRAALTLVGDADRLDVHPPVPLLRLLHGLPDRASHALPDDKRVLLHPSALFRRGAGGCCSVETLMTCCSARSTRSHLSAGWRAAVSRRRPSSAVHIQCFRVALPPPFAPGLGIDLRELHLAGGDGAAVLVVQEEACALGACTGSGGATAVEGDGCSAGEGPSAAVAYCLSAAIDSVV